MIVIGEDVNSEVAEPEDSMNAEHENALRSVTKKCRTEIILDKYTNQIAALPPDKFPARQWLVYFVRVVDKEMN